LATPLVSVVIPVYNRADLVKRAVASVCAQTFRDFELLVVDDASTEALRETVEGVGDPRIRYLRRDIRGGAGAARNTGIHESHGAYLAFLDSGDEWLPEKLDAQIDYLKRQGDRVPLCCTGFVLHRQMTGQDSLRASHSLFLYRDLASGCGLSPGTTLLAERRVFDAAGGFDEELACLEDWDWLLRSAERWPIAVLPSLLAHVHRGAGPGRADLRAACARLWEKHEAALAQEDPACRRRFRAALTIEQSAASYRERHYVSAAALLVRSFIEYPTRDRFSFRRRGRRRRGRANLSGSPAEMPTERAPAPRVLHVINGLRTGGAEGMLTSLVLAEKAEGRTPSVIALTPGGVNYMRLQEAGVQVRHLGMRSALDSLLALFRLAAAIRRERPAVVMSWMYYADLMATIALFVSGRRGRTRLAWGVRCSDLDLKRYRRQLRVVVRGCAFLSRWPDAIIANSEAGIEVHRRLGYRPRCFLLLDNGIDTARFRPDPEARRAVRRELGIGDDAPLLAIVARVDPMKDYDSFLAALERLPGVEALAIGEGTEELADRPGLHRLGRRQDVPRLLAASDLLVSCSAFGEGFPNVVAEAMASGLAVVATEVGDARRIVGDAGVILPPREPEGLAQAIQGLLGEGDVRRAMGTRGRRRIEAMFSLERAAMNFDRTCRLLAGTER
jgi:glycosyltransferase involved in cell wall biosynthesis